MKTVRPEARDAGVAAVEYGMLVALIATAVLTAVATVGHGVEGSFERGCRALAGGSSAAPAGGGGGLATAPGLTRPRCR